MKITADEYGCLQQLARGTADPLPLNAVKTPWGYDISDGWAERQIGDWRAQHPTHCHCWKVPAA